MIADVLLACFVLLLFAYIHHGRAYLNDEKVGGGSQIIDISEKPKELQLTLTAPAANVGESVKATCSVISTAGIQKTKLVFGYDPSKLEPEGD